MPFSIRMRLTANRWHLDLKPENIFIVSSKGKLSFKVGSLDICHFGTVLGGVITQLELDKFGIQEYCEPARKYSNYKMPT